MARGRRMSAARAGTERAIEDSARQFPRARAACRACSRPVVGKRPTDSWSTRGHQWPRHARHEPRIVRAVTPRAFPDLWSACVPAFAGVFPTFLVRQQADGARLMTRVSRAVLPIATRACVPRSGRGTVDQESIRLLYLSSSLQITGPMSRQPTIPSLVARDTRAAFLSAVAKSDTRAARRRITRDLSRNTFGRWPRESRA
mmetsp:Transcript_36216/g.78391  ORF Transcript_36216/g.78391 Transcript_36216/m.78391 type:complete len:201 (-) Transcript_36216:590-1192(-)